MISEFIELVNLIKTLEFCKKVDLLDYIKLINSWKYKKWEIVNNTLTLKLQYNNFDYTEDEFIILEISLEPPYQFKTLSISEIDRIIDDLLSELKTFMRYLNEAIERRNINEICEIYK